jgi:hypothetical protein
VNGTTRVDLCIYGDGGTLIQGFAVDRAGDVCAGKPCWKAVGLKGYQYKDEDAASDGVRAIGITRPVARLCSYIACALMSRKS